jgi:hypothetical protein
MESKMADFTNKKKREKFFLTYKFKIGGRRDDIFERLGERAPLYKVYKSLS